MPLADIKTPYHNHRHTVTDGSWWENDGRGIPLTRVCLECRAAKLNGFRPEVLTTYSEADVDEPIEPDGG